MAGIISFDFMNGTRVRAPANLPAGEHPAPDPSLIHSLPVKSIVPNPLQPRASFNENALYALARSIHDYGMIQPITVRRVPAGTHPTPVYELVAGERRLRAAMLLSLERVPCIVIDTDMKTSGELAIIENLQREDLNFFEQANALQRLIDLYSYTQEQAASKISVSQSYVANKLRLLRLTPAEQRAILDAGLTERHARALLRVPDPKLRAEALSAIIGKSLNVANTDKYIERLLSPGSPAPAAPPPPRRTLILKDIRLFLNSIDKAIDMVSQSGISIKSEKVDKGDYIELCLIVPKNRA